MDLDEFWRVIDTIDRTALWLGRERAAVKPLVYELALRDEADVLRFADLLAERLYELDGRVYAEAAGECGLSADWFLYTRCYVVALGREHYEAVRADPSRFPTDPAEAFESLLYAARWAWASVTGRDADEWDHRTPVSYETGSNRAAWESASGAGLGEAPPGSAPGR